MNAILEMKNIKKKFGGVHALNGIDFSLNFGEVHALLGENGAGKSTLMKILGGIYRPDEGEIRLNGKKVLMDDVGVAQLNGIAIIHQEIVLVPHLSVARNIFLGREPVKGCGIIDFKTVNEEARHMVHALGLDIDVTEHVENLTIAQQQMVEIVKAISFNVKVLVMDEPTSSLSDEEVEILFHTIDILKEKGVSIIYISHRMEELFKVSDRVTVIRDGCYIGTRETGKTDVNELVSMMVGRTMENLYTRTYNELSGAKTVLEVRHLSGGKVFHDISFSVRQGEILGFSGLIGSGRSEIMMSIFGCEPFRTGGSVFLNGKEVNFRSPMEATHSGIGFVPEDRKRQGLILNNSTGNNITLAALRFIMNGCIIDSERRSHMVASGIEKLGIKVNSEKMDVSGLSGGNQQKVVLAKWLATQPSLLILDEPTRGVDVGAKYEIYTIINKLAADGLAVILISSELPEIINMCDSVCVIRNGELVKRIPKEKLTQEYIMLYAAGGNKTNE